MKRLLKLIIKENAQKVQDQPYLSGQLKSSLIMNSLLMELFNKLEMKIVWDWKKGKN